MQQSEVEGQVGRWTGPVERLSRRAGVDLMLKGERRMARKGGLERRGGAPPGQHGIRRRKVSLFGQQLDERQRAKRFYGVRERQFRRYYQDALRSHGEAPVGERMLSLLEQRLDNVVVRLGYATTRRQARQFVNHGHIQVNGERIGIPSYRVMPGDVVRVAPSAPIAPIARRARELTARIEAWLDADPANLAGTLVRPPARSEIDTPVREQLIIEGYSRG